MHPAGVSQADYGRALLELGFIDEPRLRALWSVYGPRGSGLREHLLQQGLIGAGQDARALAFLRERARLAGSSADSRGSSAEDAARIGSRGVLPTRLPAAGEAFAGCVIEHEIARGGAGAVFAARAPDGRRCAIKVLLGDIESGNHRERFQREAKAGQTIDHPGVVRVFAWGEEAGLPYLVMEFLEDARPLDDYVEGEALNPVECGELVVQAAEAVEAAHRRGLIHRDLKPDNVLVLPGGTVKVVDFGLARHLEAERLTRTGAVMGTLFYMAPEQVLGKTAHADARTDVYALGIILYRLVTGELPFSGDTSVATMRAIAEEELPALVPRASGVDRLPLGLDAVVRQAVAKQPDERYPSAQAFARDLARALAGRELPRALQRSRSRRRRRLLAAGLSLLLLGALSALGRELWGTRGPAPLAPQELRDRAGAIHGEAWSLLMESEDPLTSIAPRAAELSTRLANLRSRAAGPDERLARAAARVDALSGLVALAQGRLPAAQQALAALDPAEDGPTPSALRGAVAAIASASDAQAAERALGRALARGIRRPELRYWRTIARVRAGLRGESEASEALADLEAAVAARGGDPDAEARTLRAHILLALSRVEEAAALLKSLPDAPPALRWQVALGQAEALFEAGQYGTAYKLLDALPPQDPLDPARAILRERALQGVTARLQDASQRGEVSLNSRVEGEIIALCALAKLLVEAPLPPPLLEKLLQLATDVRAHGNLRLGLAVAALHPDDLEVQTRVGSLATGMFSVNERRQLAVPLRRAIELERRPAERVELQRVLAITLARANDQYAFRFQKDECREVVELAGHVLPRLSEPLLRAELLIARSEALRLLGDLEGSLRDIEQALDTHSVAQEFEFAMALTYHGLGRKEDALRLAFQASIRPEDAVHCSRAAVMVWELTRETGEDAKARRALEQMMEHKQAYPGWWVRLAYLQLRSDDAEAAAHSMELAVHWFGRLRSSRDLIALRPRVQQAARAVSQQPTRALAQMQELVNALERLRGPGRRTP